MSEPTAVCSVQSRSLVWRRFACASSFGAALVSDNFDAAAAKAGALRRREPLVGAKETSEGPLRLAPRLSRNLVQLAQLLQSAGAITAAASGQIKRCF